MAYEQVETILKHACAFHENVSDLYCRLANHVEQERGRLLLNSMSEHEQRRADVLKIYIEEASQQIMHTWLTSSTDSMALLKRLDPNNVQHSATDSLQTSNCKCNESALNCLEPQP